MAMLWSAGALAQSSPPSFSADIVSLDSDGALLTTTAKLFAANHKVRIEMAGAADSFFIGDVGAGTTLVVRPSQRLYMDARQSNFLTQIFVWVDPRDPCRQWQAAAATAGVPTTRDWHCEPLERAKVKQHGIIEFSVVSSDLQPQLWLGRRYARLPGEVASGGWKSLCSREYVA